MRKRDYILAIIFGILIWAFFFLVTGARCAEKDYQKAWCDDHKGRIEVVTPDGARADCVTEEYAIEFDFAHKWAESIGQALYYGIALNKKPGIVLIVGENDGIYLQRLLTVQKALGFKVWTIKRK